MEALWHAISKLPRGTHEVNSGEFAGVGQASCLPIVKVTSILVEMESAQLDYELTVAMGERAVALRQIETLSITLEQMGRAIDATASYRFDELTAQKLELEAKRGSLWIVGRKN